MAKAVPFRGRDTKGLAALDLGEYGMGKEFWMRQEEGQAILATRNFTSPFPRYWNRHVSSKGGAPMEDSTNSAQPQTAEGSGDG